MASIIENVRAKRDTMHEENRRGNPQPLLDNAKLAIAALHDGVGSQAWETYMLQFADNTQPAQLKRLKATDSSAGDDVLRMRRAYLVGNAVCGITTDTNLDFEVNTIDDGIGGGCAVEEPISTKFNI